MTSDINPRQVAGLSLIAVASRPFQRSFGSEADLVATRRGIVRIAVWVMARRKTSAEGRIVLRRLAMLDGCTVGAAGEGDREDD